MTADPVEPVAVTLRASDRVIAGHIAGRFTGRLVTRRAGRRLTRLIEEAQTLARADERERLTRSSAAAPANVVDRGSTEPRTQPSGTS
jgi:hypothetical protein